MSSPDNAFPTTTCDSKVCQASVIFAVSAKSGSLMIVDAELSPKGKGNVKLEWRGGPKPLASVLSGSSLFGREDLRVVHQATCKDALRRRRGGRK